MRRPSAEPVVRAGLLGLGAALAARGAWLLLAGTRPGQWISVGLWLAAGSVVHDLLLAPASLLAGRALHTRTGRWPWLAGPLRGLWLGLGCVLLLGLPLVTAAGFRRNPTVIPGRPVLDLLVSVALVIAGVGLAIAVNRLRARRAPGRATRT